MTRGRPSRRRSELERLLDLTVLGPTHPELGTCWRFTGDDHALRAHRQGAGQLHPPARLEAPPRPNSRGQGAPPPMRRLRLLEPGPSGAGHACREPRLQAQGAAAGHSEAPASNRRERRCGRARLRPPVRLPSVRCADSRRQGDRPPVSQRRPFLPERRILRAPSLCESGPSRGCHAPREHEPEPKQHRHQESSQDALPARTPVRPGQHAGDATWRSSLPACNRAAQQRFRERFRTPPAE